MSIESFEAVLVWVAANAPRTFAGLNGPLDTKPSGDYDGSPLLGLYAVANGGSSFDDQSQYIGTLFPQGYFYSYEESVTEQQLALEVRGNARVGGAAGEATEQYSRELLPLAGLDGNFYYVDMRPGPLFASVGWWDNVAGGSAAQWRDLDSMFEELLQALVELDRFTNFTPAVVDGILDWA